MAQRNRGEPSQKKRSEPLAETAQQADKAAGYCSFPDSVAFLSLIFKGGSLGFLMGHQVEGLVGEEERSPIPAPFGSISPLHVPHGTSEGFSGHKYSWTSLDKIIPGPCHVSAGNAGEGTSVKKRQDTPVDKWLLCRGIMVPRTMSPGDEFLCVVQAARPHP